MRSGTILFLTLLATAAGQQVADEDFRPAIDKPAYVTGEGPRVAIDAAHYNFHTAEGRYKAFADFLRRDGYRVSSSEQKFSNETLEELDILVISNALHESNAKDWAPPNPSAFTDAEIEAVARWVRDGGSLMLIADHQPFPGAASKLGEELGIEFKNIYAAEGPPGDRRGGLIFRKEEGSLAEHQVTEGVEAVANFTGSAFRVSGEHVPLLRLSEQAVGAVREAGELDRSNVEPIGGWLQGALLFVGEGRVAVFAEAAMFSAQLAGPERRPMGMNAPQAKDNPRFLLNVMHWLSGASPPAAAISGQNQELVAGLRRKALSPLYGEIKQASVFRIEDDALILRSRLPNRSRAVTIHAPGAALAGEVIDRFEVQSSEGAFRRRRLESTTEGAYFRIRLAAE